MNILLIAGHGDGDPGALGNGYKEADLTRDLVSRICWFLSPYAKVDIFDTNKNMYKYLKSGNKYPFNNYDYVLEVHFNAFDKNSKGTEILVHTTEGGTSVEEAIINNVASFGFVKRSPKTNGVVRRSDLLVMNTVKKTYKVSHALIEVCFIDNESDMVIYKKNTDDIAKAIAKGIVVGFGLSQNNKEVTNVEYFNDIKDNYAESAIKDLKDMGIVNGYSDGSFKPNNNITRGEAAIMIRNAIKYIKGE